LDDAVDGKIGGPSSGSEEEFLFFGRIPLNFFLLFDLI
jgi:hypothetical protein